MFVSPPAHDAQHLSTSFRFAFVYSLPTNRRKQIHEGARKTRPKGESEWL
jgi:hypothetical protein